MNKWFNIWTGGKVVQQPSSNSSNSVPELISYAVIQTRVKTAANKAWIQLFNP